MKKLKNTIPGFSKLDKEEKLDSIVQLFDDPEKARREFESYWNADEKVQHLFDEFSENTISNFYLPFNIAPNFLINNKVFMVPMVIEESSVVAAASKSAKFWSTRGGFKAEVLSTQKVGQTHFIWHGNGDKLKAFFPEIREIMMDGTFEITQNMQKRGGGITDISLKDMTSLEPGYYQVNVTFETCDAMGANFINSCLEEIAKILQHFIQTHEIFTDEERDIQIVMSILSNYTPQSIVRASVSCAITELGEINGLTPQEFVSKFDKAIKIAEMDPYRATTHNKGIFNGIDAIVLATGNDFRAVEACGHAYASHTGQYRSLTQVQITENHFKFAITLPLALGVVGGLTALHPLAKRSLQLLGNPDAKELMMITASVGLASNFAAIKSLITTGIQKGHMKMHLLNILKQMNATEGQIERSIEYFKDKVVSYNAVRQLLYELRENAVVF